MAQDLSDIRKAEVEAACAQEIPEWRLLDPEWQRRFMCVYLAGLKDGAERCTAIYNETFANSLG